MRCKETAYQLQLYLDGRLNVEQIRALEAHISRCAVCQEEHRLLEEIAQSLRDVHLVVEPADLTMRIMDQVAITPMGRESRFSLLRASLHEILAVVILATVATLGSILAQPSVRTFLPITNGHDAFSLAILGALHLLREVDAGTLTWALWVGGTILGVCITLVFAGNEIRSEWLKALMERLPVR